MDFQERMEEIRREMERRRQEYNNKVGNYKKQFSQWGNSTVSDEANISNISEEGINSPLIAENSPLIHHKGLEDESETKLGMFEKIYTAYCKNSEERSFASFGYSDFDFSPLVNLLAGIGEIELYESLACIANDILPTPLNKKKTTYGDFISLLKEDRCKKYLLRYIADINIVIKQLQSIRMMRNSANHKGVVTRELFDKFFKKYYVPFFNETVPVLIKIKNNGYSLRGVHLKNLNPSEHRKEQIHKTNEQYGAMLESLFSNIVPNEGCLDPMQICVLWTNSKKLAIKYDAELNIDFQQNIKGFLSTLEVPNIKYLLLDASDHNFEKYIQNDDSWQSHQSMLQKFHDSVLLTLGVDHPVSLYIIGGDDVIPMPKVGNPVSYSIQALEGLVLEDTIEVDWLYSFPKKCTNLDVDGCLLINNLSLASPIFYVSRLPLESGLMETTIGEDIGGYFRKSMKYLPFEIKVEKVGAVAMEICRNVMDKTIEGFPRCDLRNFGVEYSYNNFFVSPKIMLDIPDEEYKVLNEYVTIVRNCDMLTFDLHGSPRPGDPDYCGQSATENNSCPKAFSREILSNSNVKILVPISCWGARFIGYRRDNSMLLHAMYNTDALLFMGSCRSAYGSTDKCGSELRLGSWLMRLFMINLLSGIRAGEALYRAKIDYLKNYSDGGVHDFLTVQQFNLFGDPMLKVKPCISSNEITNQFVGGITMPEFSWTDYKYKEKCVYNTEKSSVSVLEQVREVVDRNLDEIRKRMNEVLYKHYNIPPENLRMITRFVTGKGERGMRFVYSDKGAYPSTVMVYADDKGELKDIVYSF